MSGDVPQKKDSLKLPPVRILPDDVANKIAAGEVVERPASVVKELLENALDAGATRVSVRVVAAGRRLIEVIDNGHGMSEQNALLAIERHATSKIRAAEDLDDIRTMGFRGEALASIASVSRFTLVTRRAHDESATRVSIDGGVLRGVDQVGAPVGTRITVNRLYFNTPVRAKFLKGVTTELGHCIDAVQRHALSREGVGFQFFHNEKQLLDIPEHASLKERVALIWGLNFAKDMVEVSGEQAGFKLRGVIGLPGLTRSQRSHQFFFMNQRPVVNRSLQYGFEDGYHNLVTIGRHPVGIILLETHPRFVDVNIHPTKREIRFRDDRAVRDAVRDIVRQGLAEIQRPAPSPPVPEQTYTAPATTTSPIEHNESRDVEESVGEAATQAPQTEVHSNAGVHEPRATAPSPGKAPSAPSWALPSSSQSMPGNATPPMPAPSQTEFDGVSNPEDLTQVVPDALYEPVRDLGEAPLQLFDTYLLVPDDDRLLIIDQHALHERLNYDSILRELEDNSYESQQLAVPIVLEVAPSQQRLAETNLHLFQELGIEIEPFGGNTFQVTAICHLYDDALVRDMVYQLLDELGQGDLFDREKVMADMLRLATRACKASVRAGDPLTPMERRSLLDGFSQLRPPYTCPHGRPIIVELTQHQMEKSFRRIQ